MCTDTTHSSSTQTDPSVADGDDEPATETIHASFDEDPDAVLVAIVESVAALTDRNLTAMPPLFATIDSEALAELVTSPRERPVEVTFSYEGCRVTVSSCGDVFVEPPTE